MEVLLRSKRQGPKRYIFLVGSSPDYNLSELVKAMNIKHGTMAPPRHHQEPPLVPSPTGRIDSEHIF
jgi:hypothetical protein